MSDTKTNQIRSLLTSAESHFSRSEWREAEACFDRVLELDPQNRVALTGRDEVHKKISLDADIQDKLKEGQKHLRALNFREAIQSLDAAQAIGALNGILAYHAQIRILRDQAQDALNWRATVEQGLAEARQSEQGRPENAVTVLRELLHKLTANSQDDLAGPVRTELTRLVHTLEVDQQIHEAQQAFDEQDMERACQLAQELEQRYPNRQDVKRLASNFCRRWSLLKEQLTQAQNFLGAEKLEDAVVMIGHVRKTVPKNPNWQALWLRVHSDQGQNLMAQARAAIVQQDFLTVKSLIDKASSAFSAVLDVFPNHAPSERALAEMQTWDAWTTRLLQVRQNELSMEWEAALDLLDAAHAQVVKARGQEAGNQVYADIEGMVASMQARIHAAQRRHRSARTALRDGQDSLQQHRIDRAIEHSQRGLEELGDLPDLVLQHELSILRRNATAQRERALELLQTAHAATQTARALELLNEVYQIWPTAPGMPMLLGERLLTEIEVALAAQNNSLAAQYARQVIGLALLPEDIRQQAQSLLDRVDCRGLVLSAVQSALQRHHTALQASTMPSLAEYREIRALLDEAHGRAQRNCNDTLQEVVRALAEVQLIQIALEQAEPKMVAARAAQEQGQWKVAADFLAAAVDEMKDRAPVSLRNEARQLSQRAAEFSQLLEQTNAQLHVAQSAYQNGSGGRLDLISWETFFTATTNAQPLLERIRSLASPHPPEVATLEKSLNDLRNRGKCLYDAAEALRTGQSSDGLRLLRAASELYPGDSMLASIYAQTRQQQSESTRAHANEIFEEVRVYAMREEWENALSRLNEASKLEVNATEIERERQRISRQKQTWNEIKQLQKDAELKRGTDSRLDAKRAYDEAIRLASYPDSGLSVDLRNAINDLIGSFTNLFDPNLYASQGNELLAGAKKSFDLVMSNGSKNPLTGRLSVLVKDWYDLSITHARFGYVSSAEALEKFEDAYAVAKEQLRDTPDDAAIKRKATELRTRITEHLEGSVKKRIARAEQLAAQGSFDRAIEDLSTLESLAAPIQNRFPEIGGADTLQQLLQQADMMQLQITRLQTRARGLAPLVEQMNQNFTVGQLKEVERLLNQADVLDPDRTAKYLWEDIDSMSRLVRRRRQEGEVERLDNLLATVRVRLETDETMTPLQLKSDVLKVLEENLTRVRELDKRLWPNRQDEFEALLVKARERYRHLEDAERSWRTAQELSAAQDWEEAVLALERGEPLARGELRESIRRELERVKPRAEIQRKRRESVEAGKRSLSMRRFTEAIASFADAIQMDAPSIEIQPFLIAAQAGQYLELANNKMLTNPKEAERLLQEAIRVAAHLESAQELRQEAEANLAAITQRLEHAANIAKRLQAAESALAKDQLQAAGDELDIILQIDQAHPSAQELKRKVNEAMRAQTLLASAEELYGEKRYREAVALVAQSLDIYPLTAAQQLSAKLQAEQGAGEALTRAQSLAQEGRFRDARQELQMARDKNPNHPRLAEAQQAIKDIEEQYIARVRRPIDEAVRKRNYREAMRASQAAVQTVGLPDWVADLQQRQQTILEEWFRALTSEARPLLEEPENEQTDRLLAHSIEQLNAALAAASDGTQRVRHDLHSLVVQLEVRRGKMHLHEAERLLDSPGLSAADLRRCEQIVQEIAKKAGDISDFELRWIVEDIQQKLEDRRHQKEQDHRNNRLAAAQQLFDQAKNAADLAQASQRVNEILAIPAYNNDTEALQLRSQIQDEERRLRTTTEKIEQAKRSLRNGNFNGAQETLQLLDSPSRLLRTDIERLLNLVEDLINAEDQENDNPQLALGIYEKAGASGFDLGASLTTAVRRCRNNLIQQVEEEVNRLLHAVIPDVQTVRQRLSEVRTRGWAQSVEQEQRMTQMETLAARKEQIAQAITILEQGGDATHAVALLRGIRQQVPQSELEKSDEGWLVLAQARVALNQGRMEETAHLLQDVLPGLRTTAACTRLQNDLNMALETAKQFGTAAAALDHLLTALPPDFAAAVQIVRQLPQDNPLTRRVRRALEETIARRREGEDYRTVRDLASHLLRLLSREEEQSVLVLLNDSEQERNERLAAAIKNLESALEQDDMMQADNLLGRARRLDVDQSITRLDDLERQINMRRPVLQEMHQKVQVARDAMLKTEYTEAVTAAAQAQQLISSHTAVKDLLRELRAQLRTTIDQRIAGRHFGSALRLCDEALRLGPDPQFSTLRISIDADRRSAIDQLVAEANHKLVQLDIPAAERAVSQVRAIEPGDSRVGRLEHQLEERRMAVPQLSKSMEQGWDALQRRDLGAAVEHFRIAGSMLPDFEEPQLWRNYVDNFKEGVAQALEERYDVSINSLEQAATGLRYADVASLSPLWAARLGQERRRAVYNAVRLQERVTEMLHARRQGDAAKQQSQIENALHWLKQLRELHNSFSNFARTVFEPTPDFDARTVTLRPKPAIEPVLQSLAAGQDPVAASPLPMESDSSGQGGRRQPDTNVFPSPAPSSSPLPPPLAQPLPSGKGEGSGPSPIAPDVAAWDDFFGDYAVKSVD